MERKRKDRCMDISTTSTQYRQLPDQLSHFLRLTQHPKGAPASAPAMQTQRDQSEKDSSLKYLFRNPVASVDTGLASIFQHAGDPPQCAEASRKSSAPEREEPKTYFRDFNEILKMDPQNPPKKIQRHQISDLPDLSDLPDFSSAPYNILSAISNQLLSKTS